MAYYVLNTNNRNSEEDDKYMLLEKKAAAFFSPWKYTIEKFVKGDIIFLYRAAEGIIAMGTASGIVEKRSYQNDELHPEEEYCQLLSDFRQVRQPLKASQVKAITGVNHLFHSMMFPMDEASGDKLLTYIAGQKR